MKTKAVRFYGKNDLRLESFELPSIGEDEILASVVSDSVCMSTYKAVSQGIKHKRVPCDIDKNPVMIGHEFCGEIIKPGKKWSGEWKAGERFTIQPALNRPDFLTPGYSYKYLGGNTEYIIIPSEVMEKDCLLKYEGEAFYHGSLAEPMSCIIGGFHVNYHTKPGVYEHFMGIKQSGRLAIIGGAGPMGLGALDYALNCDRQPLFIAITDINEDRLKRAIKLFPPEMAAMRGIKLEYFSSPDAYFLKKQAGGGYDDVFVYTPVSKAVELAGDILGFDGCLNFFAGPSDTSFSANMNFYNVHYTAAHVAGNSGGNTDDMKEALNMMSKGIINPASMITHIGGLDAVIDTVINLPKIPGGKKLIYNHISMPLTAIEDFPKLGEKDPVFKKLYELTEKNNGLWSPECERFLLNNKVSVQGE